MNTNDQYALSWSNHTNHIRKAFDTLLAGNEFVDVTLSCEGKKVSAHKMLLSACSAYFHHLFRDNPCQHPIVILKDVKFQNLVDILKFIYNGEVSVSTENFDSFLKTAELLQVSGLTDDENRCEGEKEDAVESTRVEENDQVAVLHIQEICDKEKEAAKKRPVENNVQEVALQKKRKEEELKPDIEIKEEVPEVVNAESEIRDPLELGREIATHPIRELEAGGSHKFQIINNDVFKDDRSLENKCPLCFKTFTHPLSLVQHRHVHTGGTICPICKVIFSRKYNLKTHMRNVHYSTFKGLDNID